MKVKDTAVIHIDGKWTFPHNGNAGIAGQFETEQAALQFCIEQQFDTANLLNTVSGRRAYLGEQNESGKTGWIYDDGAFIGLPE